MLGYLIWEISNIPCPKTIYKIKYKKSTLSIRYAFLEDLKGKKHIFYTP